MAWTHSDQDLDLGDKFNTTVVEAGTDIREAENSTPSRQGHTLFFYRRCRVKRGGSEVLVCRVKIGPRNVGVDCESGLYVKRGLPSA
jgi:hypothetical protein